jgi:AcrR family transcriptional regulator
VRGGGTMHQAERRALTRVKLIQSAIEVFADQGYDDATVEAIVRGADLSKGAFYFHFSTKEDVFLDLLRSWATERTVVLKVATAAAESPGAGLESTLGALFRQGEGRAWSSLVLQFWVYGTKHPAIGQELRRSYRLWCNILASAVGRTFGESDLATAEEAAMAILASRDGLATEGALAWSRGRSPQPQRAAALALRVLTAMDAAGRRMRSDGIAVLNSAAANERDAAKGLGETASALADKLGAS